MIPMPLIWVAVGIFGAKMVMDTKARKKANVQRSLVEDTGIEIDAGCSDWEVQDPARARLLVELVYIEERLDGVTDPGEIAGAILARFYPQCQHFDQVRTVGELDFYAYFFEETLDLLARDGILTQEAYEAQMDDFEAWYDSVEGGLVHA